MILKSSLSAECFVLLTLQRGNNNKMCLAIVHLGKKLHNRTNLTMETPGNGISLDIFHYPGILLLLKSNRSY